MNMLSIFWKITVRSNENLTIMHFKQNFNNFFCLILYVPNYLDLFLKYLFTKNRKKMLANFALLHTDEFFPHFFQWKQLVWHSRHSKNLLLLRNLIGYMNFVILMSRSPQSSRLLLQYL